MSYINSPGTALTSAEVDVIVSLTNLAVTPGGDAITKSSVSPNTFVNTAVSGSGGTWYTNEALTLDGDKKTFHLAHAPASTIFLLGGHQPQIYGVDFTGTINGINKDFAYATAQDTSVLNDQYATYL